MEYILNFQVRLDFDKFSDEDKLRIFEDYISRKIDGGKVFDVTLKETSDLPKEDSKFFAEFSLDEVFSKLTDSKERIKFEKNGKHYFIRMNSQRYFLFKQSQTCVSCGLKGTRFFVEKDPGTPHHHFNLYGEEDGNLVLFTKDHVLAKANGGTDQYSNYQVMCAICNNLKGSHPLTPEKVKILREFHRQLKDKKNPESVQQMNQKKIELLENPSDAVITKAVKQQIVHAISDLKIVRTKQNKLIGTRMKSEIDGEVIACVGHDQELDVVSVEKKDLKISFNDEFYEVRKDLTNYFTVHQEIVKRIKRIKKILRSIYLKKCEGLISKEEHNFESHFKSFFDSLDYLNRFQSIVPEFHKILTRLNLIERKKPEEFSLDELKFFKECAGLIPQEKGGNVKSFVDKWDSEFKLLHKDGNI